MTTWPDPDPTRAARIKTIRNSAIVRSLFGQGAGYIFTDGMYQITVLDSTTRTTSTYTGKSLDEVLEKAKTFTPFTEA